MRKNHLKFTWKEKKNDYREILGVINKSKENVKRKKTTKAQTMTVESKRVKTTIKHPMQSKINFANKNKVENNSKLLLSGKFDFDPQEILDKSLLFDLKKTSGEKIFGLILEKLLGKDDIYYIGHR